jgi:eukaryotic-like serine/threonine-protein kinase
MMKKGDVINGYVLTTDAQNGGGQCEWAFATKDGEAFFIKRFLSPTYPVAGSPGSEQTKADKRARSDEFERQQRKIMRKLGEISGEGGNLVVARAFFREGAHFYKVTLKVDVSHIGSREIAKLPRDDRILIMLTAAKSLETLHRASLVHGDVKPDNLLVRALPGGGHAIKVIDFDNCFTANNPAPANQLVGDVTYYSPELYLYQVGEGRGDVLDDKNDVFALGLVFWQYLTGALPSLPPGKPYAAQAVLAGTRLSLPKSVRDVPVAEVVEAMLTKEASDRPSMSEVHSSLKIARKSLPEGKPSRLAPRESVRLGEKPGGIRGKLFHRRAATATDAAAAASTGGKPSFTGTLFRTGTAPVPGLAPRSASDAEIAMPGGPTIDAAPPRADVPPDGAATGSDGAGARIRGTLKSKAETAPADAPDGADAATSGRLGGTLWRKASAGAKPIVGPDAVRDAGEDVAAEDGDATTEPTTKGSPRRRLLKRRE